MAATINILVRVEVDSNMCDRQCPYFENGYCSLLGGKMMLEEALDMMNSHYRSRGCIFAEKLAQDLQTK